MIDFLFRLFGQFDRNGLRYSVGHLKSIEKEIVNWPVRKQLLYADIVTFDAVNDNDIVFLQRQFLALRYVSWKSFHLEYLNERGKRPNATAVGNAAYVAINCLDERVALAAAHWLATYKAWDFAQRSGW